MKAVGFSRLLLGLIFGGLVIVGANAATIIADNYNVTATNTGFALNAGVNFGINPPTTRLTGNTAANLRYINTGTKATSAYTISGNKLAVSAAANPGRFVLSADGATAFNFATALGIGAATPTNRVAYDIAISMKNNSSGAQRFSFALGTAEGDANTWDFGVQVYRASASDNFYTLGKRIDTGASGLGADLNKAILTMTPHTYGMELDILMRITDAGAESSGFNSRVQLSLNGGNSWFYDTDTDPDLAGTGWRLNGSDRIIMWDAAPDAGPVTYDRFSVKSPPVSNANTGPTFRAMAYNIHWAAGPDGDVNTQRIADFILDQDVDLVAFNEVARFWAARAGGRDIIGEIAQQTGMTFVFSNNNTELTGNAQFGNAILSKYPVLLRDHRLLPRENDNEQRGWLKAVVDVNGKFLSFWTTHLDFKADHTERLKCVTNFNNWVADETLPVIFGGDFNDTPGSPMGDRMDLKWTDIWPVAGDGSLGRTVPCPGPPFNARIDYIWKAKSSPQITPFNAEVGYGIEASDHYPVLSQFVMNIATNHVRGFYFSFDQGSGAQVTDSIGGLKGNFTSGAASWSPDSPTGQTNDFSLFFNGARKITAIDTNQIVGTNGLNADYTLQAWVKLAVNYAPPKRAILFQYERQPGFSISINTNRTLHTTTFKVKDIASTATLPNDGQWHHVAVVHTDGANLKFYIDGVLAATVAYANGAGFRTSSEITIGAASEGDNWFTGNLDRISYEQSALTPAQFDFPATPRLGIRPNGNALTVFWRAGSITYGLQSNGSLSAAGWSNVSTTLQGEERQTAVAPTNAARFYRLKKQ